MSGSTRSPGWRAKRALSCVWRRDDPTGPAPAQDCRFDVVSLGEVVLRLDPGEGRIRTARKFTERGFGLRGAMGVSDRGHGALVQR